MNKVTSKYISDLMIMSIGRAKELVLNIFFPTFCYGCGEVGSYLCEFCQSRKIFCKNFQECHVCKKLVLEGRLVHKKCKEKTSLDGVIISLKYDKFVEHLIAEFKYEFVSDIKNLLGKFLISAFEKSKVGKNLIVSFVPLHSKRKRWRGYNQSEELAKNLAIRLNFEVQDLLERRKFSRTQVGLKRVERIENVKDSFAVRRNINIPKRVLIVDDVMTTGATLEECAKVLKEAGVQEVYGLVVARG